jgi:Polyketide cyclase / dehydrase and lipid transport
VWAIISDPTQYPQFGPWSAAGYRNKDGDPPPGTVGTVYWLKSSRRTYLLCATSVEMILELNEGRSLAYTVVGGIPVKNYRADITLTPVEGATHIRWAATWDSTLGGRIVHRTLVVLYPELVQSLARLAEQNSQAEPSQS